MINKALEATGHTAGRVVAPVVEGFSRAMSSYRMDRLTEQLSKPRDHHGFPINS